MFQQDLIDLDSILCSSVSAASTELFVGLWT